MTHFHFAAKGVRDEQCGGIPVIHIVAPGAMGTSNPVASNANAEGRAENRRVDVKVLLNKGLNEQ
jgi:outer membrane protein OmpA-like peptidoglycan-associated protein